MDKTKKILLSRSPTCVINVHCGSLSNYISQVDQYTTLSAEEEKTLLSKFYRTKEWSVAQPLVLGNLKFVVYIAKSFSGYQLNQADLIQEGNLGLIKALQHYNPKFNVRLMAFAVHWIRAQIYEFVLNNWKIVRMANNKHQRKLFFNLRKFFHGDPSQSISLKSIADHLNVPLQEAQKMLPRMFSGTDLSFDELSDSDASDLQLNKGGDTKTIALALVDKTSDFSKNFEEKNEEMCLNNQVKSSLQKLDERSRDILCARWLKDPKETLQMLSDRHQISLERVRQLEKKALLKFKELFQKEQENHRPLALPYLL